MFRKHLAPFLLVLCLVTVAPAASPEPFVLLHSLFDHGTNVQADAQHDYSVAVDGNLAVVGVPYIDVYAFITSESSHDAGEVRVYAATTGTQLLTLTNPSPGVGEFFGWSVAISGTRVVVGAPFDTTDVQLTGSAYVYDLAGAMPATPVLVLTNPTPKFADRFGWSVAISGTRVVVGASRDDTGTNDAGSAYVYNLVNASPAVPALILTNPTPGKFDVFGMSVGISGSRVVVGAPGDDTGAADTGSAYVYDLASAKPAVPMVTLTNPGPAGGDLFGSGVAISQNWVVVSSKEDHVPGMVSGSALVFDLGSASPTVPALVLTRPNAAGFDLFGCSVSISGAMVVVGAYGDNTGTNMTGSAYVYDLASATPAAPLATLRNPNPVQYAWFGWAVATDGSTVVAAVKGADSAYVFGLRPTLSIAPAALGLATISWSPTNSPGFVLQYAESLAPTNWLTAPSGATNPVTVSTTNTARFYRLAQP